MKIIENFISSRLWFFCWIINTSAFILLPLLIYIIIGTLLNDSIDNLLKLPELMFIAVILYGEALNKSITLYYKIERQKKQEALIHYLGFTKESQFAVSFAMLGITISSVLLTFVIIANYKEFEIPSFFIAIEKWVFLFALMSSAVSEYDTHRDEEYQKNK